MTAASLDPASPDPHSHARPSEARVKHLSFDLRADFDARQLSGRVYLDLRVAPDAAVVVLDTCDLRIHRVTDGVGQALDWSLGERDAIRGQALTIALSTWPKVVIEYETDPEAAALQWLTPDQTAGGVLPFLYSQGHALLTRSWLPTQDSPSVRHTFRGRLDVPATLHAVMSAEGIAISEPSAGGRRTFEFAQPNPIPAYLIALAVGDLAFRSLGPRTGVLAEPAVLDRAHNEFADLERMLGSAEAVVGRYRWDRLDVLVMPPAFPFGGMENPRLMFVSPSILAGDRSLTSLLAHELAHAWSGNLVTNATWDDFWLNEGFTVYLELRIVEALYGRSRAEMLEVYGHRLLAADLQRLDAADTRLKVDLQGRSPLEGVTTVPYVKGAALLHLIEREVGRERFDRYLRSWFDRHAFTSVTTDDFVADLRGHLFDNDPTLEATIRIDEWLHQPGLPANAIVAASPKLAAVDAQAVAFAGGTSATALEVSNWSTQEWRHFLMSLTDRVTRGQLLDLDRLYQLTNSRNTEVLFAWLRLAIQHQYGPASATLERFLLEQGRRKYLEPLYRELMTTTDGRRLARDIYTRARPRYHSTTRSTLDPLVLTADCRRQLSADYADYADWRRARRP